MRDETFSHIFPFLRTGNNQSSLSLISNMTSEQGDSSCQIPDNVDVDDDEDDDDAGRCPLFLQVSATVRYGRDCLENISISRLLTCFVDLLREHSFGDSLDAMEFDKLSVTLDFICITLPRQGDLAKLENQMMMRSSSVEGEYREVRGRNDYGDAADDPNDESQEDGDPDRAVDPLSKVQRKAVAGLVDEIRWILEDEVIFAQTRSQRIGHDLVEKVVAHIGRSHGKPGSSILTIPLNFVFGHDPSFELFEKEMEAIRVACFRRVRSGEYVYFVQNTEASDHDSSEVRPTFWLVMRVAPTQVDLFFQYREGQLAAVLPWRQAQQQISHHVEAAMKRVNQVMLLNSMHDTRYNRAH